MAASNVDETVKFKYQEFGCRAVRNNYNWGLATTYKICWTVMQGWLCVCKKDESMKTRWVDQIA
jgi:hypothetical protein